MEIERRSFKPRELSLALTLLAFALRVYRLGAQSLWFDEAFSVDYARRGLDAWLAGQTTVQGITVVELHPPLYFALLNVWMLLAGAGEFAVRFGSAACGVLLVPLAFVVGRRLFSVRTGLLAALLTALSPFLIYYSQEARPYIQPAFFALLAFYVFLRALDDNRPRTWALYALATLVAVNFHYYAALATAAQGLYLLLRIRTLRAQFLRWLAAMLAVAALYAPLLPTMLRQLGSYGVYWAGTIGLDVILPRSLAAFGAGLTTDAAWGLVSGGLLLLLTVPALLHGLWAWRRLPSPRRRPAQGADRWAGGEVSESDRVLLLVLYLVVPVLAVYLSCLIKPKFHERFVIVAAPAVYLLAARGVDVLFARVLIGARYRVTHWIHQATFLVVVALLVLTAGRPLSNLYFDPTYARDDYRAVAQAIQAHQEPGDVILLCAPYIYPSFTYYYHGGLPWDGLPKQTPADRTQTAAALNDLTAGRNRLWLVLWQDYVADPEGFVLDQLSTKCARLPQPAEFAGLRLLLFSLSNHPTFTTEPGIQHRQAALFDGRMDLLGFDLDRTSTQCGETVNLALFWQAREPLKEDVTAFVHLVNEADFVYTQVDKRPINDYLPTSKWSPGQVMKDEYRLFIPYGTPPGAYRLVVGLYRASTGQRLPVFGDRVLPGERVYLSDVYLMRAGPGQPADLRIQHPQPVDLGHGLRYLGHELSAAEVSPGEVLLTVLFWEAMGRVGGDAVVTLELRDEEQRDEAGRVVVAQQGRPANDTYPTPTWLSNAVVRDIRALFIPSDLPPGPYRLRVTVQDASGASWGQVDWATPIVVKRRA
jgi:4-amino-4-deoxy-L-arabinose transferase-like glycosyltransferase